MLLCVLFDFLLSDLVQYGCISQILIFLFKNKISNRTFSKIQSFHHYCYYVVWFIIDRQNFYLFVFIFFQIKDWQHTKIIVFNQTNAFVIELGPYNVELFGQIYLWNWNKICRWKGIWFPLYNQHLLHMETHWRWGMSEVRALSYKPRHTDLNLATYGPNFNKWIHTIKKLVDSVHSSKYPATGTVAFTSLLEQHNQ